VQRRAVLVTSSTFTDKLKKEKNSRQTVDSATQQEWRHCDRQTDRQTDEGYCWRVQWAVLPPSRGERTLKLPKNKTAACDRRKGRMLKILE